MAAIGALAKRRGLGLHMDGARFANAVATLGCTPAAVTWQAGVDALSFGFVKNGAMSAELLVFFRPDLADVTRYRRKRAGLLFSKGRYLAAQVIAMLGRPVAGERPAPPMPAPAHSLRRPAAGWSIRSRRMRCSCG